MDESKTFGADMRISGFGVFRVSHESDDSRGSGAAGAGETKIRLERLETDHFEGRAGDLSYRADQLTIDALQTTVGRSQTTAESIDLGSLEATSDDGNFTLVAHRIGCPRGVLFTSGEEVFAPHVTIEDAHIIIRDLSGLGARSRPVTGQKSGERVSADDESAGEAGETSGATGEGASAAPGDGAPDAGPVKERVPEASSPDTAPARGDAPGGHAMDWHFLDVLQGRLDLDLVLDMTLPWIGRRQATHYFRVPIENGTIDYDKLEDDVHWLEAAFLTIELVDEQLVLARDLPLVPFSGKALVVWPLQPEDIPVAKYSRVHLRNLVRPRLPSSDRKKVRSGKSEAANPGKGKDRGKSRLTLHALTLENIKLALRTETPAQISLPNGAFLQLGGEDQSGLVNLEMTGALHYESGKQTEPTALSGNIALVDVTIKDLPLGASLLSADRLHMSEIDSIELTFEGFRPRRLEIRATRIAATNLRVALGQR